MGTDVHVYMDQEEMEGKTERTNKISDFILTEGSPMKRQREIKKPSKYSTHYPSKEELAWYVENDLYKELDKRICDMIPKNLVLDGMDRREVNLKQFQQGKISKKDWEVIPLDVLKLIALRMDIRQLMTNACKTVVFAYFLSLEDFWQDKFFYDFPEIMAFETLKKLPRKDLSWKSYYLVVRLFIIKCRKSFVKRTDKVQFTNFIKHFTFNQELNMIDVKIKSITGKEIGKVKHVTFYEYLKDVKCQNYLMILLPCTSNIDFGDFICALKHGPHTPLDGHCYGIEKGHTFIDVVSRGYVRRDHNSKIMIIG